MRWSIAFLLSGALCAVAFRAWSAHRLNDQLNSARDLLRNFQPNRAIELLNPLTSQNPVSAEVEFLLACACRRAGQIDLVAPHLRRAAELGWDVDAIDRQTNLAYFQVGDFRKAGAEVMQRMQDRASDDEAEEVYEAMARGYSSAMLLKQAVFILQSWLEWRPQSLRARLMLADVFALRGDTPGEIECYRQAIEFHPLSIEARQRLGRALLVGHEFEEPFQIFTACLRELPNDPDVLLGLAECYERRGQRDEARKLLSTLVGMPTNDRQRSAALALLGQIELIARNDREAVRLLRKAVDANPANLRAVYSLSQALSHAGINEEAEVYLNRWQRAQAAEQKLDDLQAEVLNHPEDPDVRAAVGQALMEQGAGRVGVNWLVSVLFYRPTHPLANRLLADYFEREGQPELAAHHRKLAEGDLEPNGESSPSSILSPEEGL